MRTIAAQVRDAGVSCELVPDSAAAARHAARLGLLSQEAADDVPASGRSAST